MTLRQRSSRYSIFLALAIAPTVAAAGLGQTPPLTVAAAGTQAGAPQQPVDFSAESRGDLLSARQQYVDAIEAYRQAPQDSAIVANKIGVAYHHMFAVADAKRYYERAIQLSPRYAEAINNLGAIYHSQHDYKQAERLYRRAIKIAPRSPLFYSNLGTAYFFEGNIKKGAEAYRQAFALDPDVFERGSAAKIEETSSSKDLAAVNYVLAKTYAQAGQNTRALAYLRKALGEGFSDRRKLMNDPELASVRVTPEFVLLLSRERMQ